MFDSGKPADSASAVPPTATAITLDINFLPEHHRGRRLRFAPLRPWLLMAGFAVLFAPSWQLHRQQTARLRQVESDLAAISAALESYQPLAEERGNLEGRLAQAQAEILAIEDAYRIIDIQHRTWSTQIPRLLNAAPAGIEITLISQSDVEVTLEGLAQSESLPALFHDRLEALGDYVTVTIQHVTRIPLAEREPAGSDGEPADASEAEADPEPAEIPMVFSFEIRLELPAPPTAIDEQGSVDG